VALGDAQMRLSPIGGQGMTKALITAIVLDSVLRGPATVSTIPSTFARDFFKKVHAKTCKVWDAAKAQDYALSSTEVAKGESHEHGAFQRWYASKVMRLVIRGVSAWCCVIAFSLTYWTP
jgi:2-polyprenyl-6-methoxyphenol hydroxylase-like FAD-dependent oxidoreductase